MPFDCHKIKHVVWSIQLSNHAISIESIGVHKLQQLRLYTWLQKLDTMFYFLVLHEMSEDPMKKHDSNIVILVSI